MHIFKNNI